MVSINAQMFLSIEKPRETPTDVGERRHFSPKLNREPENGIICVLPSPNPFPILTLGSTSFFHIKHENVYILCISKLNANTALIFEFMQRFAKVCEGCFGRLNEESVKDNFSLIYQITVMLEVACLWSRDL
jgi:hypothetical protein